MPKKLYTQTGPEIILGLAFHERVRKLIWLFIAGVIGLILGIIGIVWWAIAVLTEVEDGGSVGNIFISSAIAQAGATDPLNLKPFIMLGLCVVLVLVLFWCLITIAMTKNKSTYQTATDMAKGLVGFFIGAATNFLG